MACGVGCVLLQAMELRKVLGLASNSAFVGWRDMVDHCKEKSSPLTLDVRPSFFSLFSSSPPSVDAAMHSFNLPLLSTGWIHPHARVRPNFLGAFVYLCVHVRV